MEKNSRILIVDDNESIHDDFKKILLNSNTEGHIEEIEQFLFDKKPTNPIGYKYIIDDAFQGEEAVEMVERAEKEGNPYSLIYMDIRMPPGIDGVQAIERIWQKHPNVEIVICSAYSDYSWEDILEKFGETDKLLFVKKPFNIIVVKQLTLSLITKWEIAKKNREYMQRLEKEVEERTKELKQLLEEMTVLKEKAEDADKMKSAFLANMSHEIRSPMNAILGFSELLDDPELDEKTKKEFLQYISMSGKSLLNLINDIIFVTKIEAGMLEIKPAAFALNTLLNEIYKIIQVEKDSKNKDQLQIEMELEENDQNFEIITDRERLKQVLINLLSNALKFTPDGSIKFGYQTSEKWLTFYVTDTGIGIPQEKIDMIFERFGQLDNRLVSKNKGTGLGLTISKNLVELLGGEIWVKSKPEEGSTFSFTLPLKKPAFASQPEEIKKKKPTQKDFSNMTILIVEDEDYNAIYFETVIRQTKARIIIATDGLDAVEKYRSNSDIDLILMDIKMPLMDGEEATKIIKQINPNVPILAQTAYALENEERVYREKGFDDYIKKPISIAELLEKVELWLSKAI